MQTEQLISSHRGARENPANRFEKIHLEPDADWNPEEDDGRPQGPRTQFLVDRSQTAIAYNDSPDIGFNAGLNPYRGCEHGCIYCYARPTHEFLGFSAGLDFESKIMVKTRAPELLRAELASPKWRPQIIFMSGVTDCYQPVERRLKLTRRCLEVLAEFRNPVALITKNFLVTRDLDALSELAKFNAVSVCLSVTTLDPELRKVMEPRTSPPAARLAAIRKLSEAGIPVAVNVAPVIPGLTDQEISKILAAAREAGARTAGFTVVRLPYAVAPLFEKWLETHFPDRKGKVLNRIRALRGGKLYDAQWGKRFTGEGIFSDQIAQMFNVAGGRPASKTIFPNFRRLRFAVRAARNFCYSRDVRAENKMSLPQLRSRLRRLASPAHARNLSWFFKTAPGEYGAGDKFIGIRVPVLRQLAREFRELPPPAAVELLQSPIHEERLLALILWVNAGQRADEAGRAEIYALYLANLDRVNNWDLVDVSAPRIVGAHLEKRSRKILFRLARSPNLWRRRVAVLATFHFIRLGDFADALRLAELLRNDEHDLMHKAVGWMLREIGKRDAAVLRQFLDRHATRMPRTMLRYAIEKLPERERQRYLQAGKA